jgi:23S rRNA (uracil1939-C5)-methyltransferase
MTGKTASVQLVEETVGAMGAKGDGRAGAYHVAFALPGERVRGRPRGDRLEAVEILSESPDRVTPPCPHFTRCGGCATQHWADGAIADWKRGLVVQALERRGLSPPVGETLAAWGGGRRRAAFHARREGTSHVFGFSRARAHVIEPIGACPVLTPGLQAALPHLRALAEALTPARETATITVLETLSGLDVDVTGAGAIAHFARKGLERLATSAQAADLARLTLEGEVAVMRRQPVIAMGRARVTPTPGAFLQATTAGEETLGRLVMTAAGPGGHAVDLFAGLGAFALRLKERFMVRAFEGDGAMTAAMKKASDGLAGGKTLTAIQRDLFRNPLGPLELKGVDLVVFDPPRAGAEAQAAQLARTSVPVVIGVSCDPQSFARDAALLTAGGYRLEAVTPVDQFRWTPHVELVGVFRL